jgi:hypothetical protein
LILNRFWSKYPRKLRTIEAHRLSTSNGQNENENTWKMQTRKVLVRRFIVLIKFESPSAFSIFLSIPKSEARKLKNWKPNHVAQTELITTVGARPKTFPA